MIPGMTKLDQSQNSTKTVLYLCTHYMNIQNVLTSWLYNGMGCKV